MSKKYNYITRHFVCKKIDNKVTVLYECNTKESAQKEIKKWKDKGYIYKPKKERVRKNPPV